MGVPLKPFRILLASALLATLAAVASAQEYAPGELLVRWKPSLKPGARTSALAALGAESVRAYRVPGLERVRVLGVSVEEAVARLSLDPRVEYAEPDWIWSIDRVPNDPDYPEQYALHNTGQAGGTPGADISAEGAWDRYTGDPELRIGILDTGAQLDHPDLAANLWTNPGEIPGNAEDDDLNGYVDDVHGYDFVNRDGEPRDDNGHGTHTAGTIAAVGNNAIGVTGVAWRARIVVLKFLNSSGNGTTSNAVEALEYASRVGVRLTNNSWGGGAYSRALEDAVAAAGDAGQLFVAAAGNARTNTDVNANYPGALPQDCIISVAATDAADQLASFSNYGPTTVDLAAPGDEILSTFVNGTYRRMSGTSMAAPHVSGAVALLWGRFPAMDAAEVKSRLLRFSDALPQLTGRCVSGGRLNVDVASADPDFVAPGGIADLRAEAAGSNSMDLAWTAPGDDGASGTARRYELRVSLQPITPENFGSALAFPAPRPQGAGTPERWRLRGLAAENTYWCALLARDEFGNAGPVSNAISFSTLGPPRLAFEPGDVSASASTGTQLVRNVEIVNASAGTLEWRALAPELDLGEGSARSAPVPVWPAPALAKGEDGPVREPVAANAGGPDAFGYRWLDSDEPGGPVFRWVDIAQPANVVAITGDEAVSARLPIGFSFPFYGRRFTTLRVCSNGYLEFSDLGPVFVNAGLPTASGPRSMVAPFWDDLHLGSGVDKVFLRSDGTRCVVSWEAVGRFNDAASRMTFQAVLYPSGEIRFQYRTMTGTTTSATAGIQDSTRTVGLTVAFNQPYVKDELAVRFVPLRQWLEILPTEGFVPPGGRQAVELRMDASGLASGDYGARARFITNDPDAQDTSVVVRLAVTGAPHLVLTPAALDFGAHFLGAHDTLSLTLANDGVDPLEVAAITTDRGAFRVNSTGFTLLPGESVSRMVEFTPDAVADFAGTLTVSSNDPVRPVATLALHGVGSETPEIEASVAQLRVAATPQLHAEAAAPGRIVLLRNSGGAPLAWTASAYQGLIGAAPAGSVLPRAGTVDPFVVAKGATSPGPGISGDGGPDAFGYRWVDSDAPGGPAFAWEEVAHLGTRLFGGADDSVATVPLPFPFTFYGRAYSSVNVCTNGFLSFVSRDTTFANTDLPNLKPGVPRALIAPLWTDLDLRAARGNGRVYAHHDGSKFILEWKDAVHFSGASPYTFQVFLWPSGMIEYQYLSLGPLTTASTVGIQDSSGTVGLTVAYNVPYLHTGLRVRFSFQDDWLKLDRTSGLTAPGAEDTLRVTFDSRDHRDGDYAGELRIASNAVEQPLLVVPCAMRVGLQTSPAEAQPGVVAAVSQAPNVRFLLLPGQPGEGVRLSSLRLGGEPVVPASDPRHEGDGRLSLEFRAVDLLARLPAQAAGDWKLSGEYESSGWFEASASLEVHAPALSGGPLPAFGSDGPPAVLRAGDPVVLQWQPPPGGADDYAVAYSPDGGLRWHDLGHPVTTQFTLVPAEASEAAMVEVVARRGDAVLGTWLTSVFIVEAEDPPPVPARFAFVRTSANPARGGATLELSLPVASDVEVSVFDTRGARVRTLAQGRMAPGRVPVAWDGQDQSGRRAAAGFYLIRALAGGNEAVVRIALLR